MRATFEIKMPRRGIMAIFQGVKTSLRKENRKMMVRLVILVSLLILLPNLSFGEEVFIAESQLGGNSGIDCSNAHSAAWFNTSGNWANPKQAGSIGPGDTVHLCGSIATALKVQASGSADLPITILFETDAKLSREYFPQSGAINVDSKSYVTIDGGTNGRIENTNNGTAKSYQNDTTGIQGHTVNYLTIKNLTITDLYVRTPGSTTDRNRIGIAIEVYGSNIMIQNNSLSEGDTLIAISYNGSYSNITMDSNSISRCNHGITVGAYTGTPDLTNLTIMNNSIDNLDVWNGVSGNHLDGIIIFNEKADYSGSITNCYIYGNTIGPDIGTITTAGIFIDVYASRQMVNMQIYNNLFTARAPYYWTNGFIRVKSSLNALIVNNTIISYSRSGIGISIGTESSGTIIKNNLLYSVGTPISLGAAASMPVNMVSDYNVFWDIPTTGTGAFYQPKYAASTWTAWKALGFDGNSTINQPLLDDNYVPTLQDTVARDRGLDLSTHFSSDKRGYARPPGKWDIGAYQYAAPKQLIPPQQLRVAQ